MTSEERHEARYQRRRAKRLEKRRKVLEEYGDYYKIINRDALSKSAKEATKNVKYKASVKRFMLRSLINIGILNRKLMYHKDVRKGFICFGLCERGKHRDIMSVHFSERVVQKSLNQNALIPVLTRSLIYDNGASRKGMGTRHAMARLVVQLRIHYRHHGRKGYVLQIDFKDYFGRISHKQAKKIISRAFDDESIRWLAFLFIDAYREYKIRKLREMGMSEEEIEAEASRGLGLGSEINQTLAITLPNPMDHYIKEVLGIKAYGRYMDDSYLIHESKEYLEYCLVKIREICAELEITISEKKTRIVKLSHGFTFLKTQVYLTETGKIIRKPCHDAIVRERRKLKKQKKLVDEGIMTYEDVRASYSSWRGSMEHRNARKTVHSMDLLYDRLFIESWKEGGNDHDKTDETDNGY